MTLTLELPPELKARLLQEAAADGTAPEEWAISALADLLLDEDAFDVALAPKRLATTDPGQRRNLADLRAAWKL